MIYLIGLVLVSIVKVLYLKRFAFYDFHFSLHYIILGNMVRITLIMIGYPQPKGKNTRVIGDRTLGHCKGVAFYLKPFLLEADMIACCTLISEELRIRPRRMETPIGRMRHISKRVPFGISSCKVELEIGVLRYYIFLFEACALQGRRPILCLNPIY